MNYTTIEQSKKLLELGLNPDTADMGYNGIEDEDARKIKYDRVPSTIPNMNSIPCWSLGALIELLPDYIEYWNKEGYFYDAFLEISKHAVAYRYFDRYQDIKIQLFEAFNESLVSSVSTTILWLLENNYIKSNKNE